MAGISLARLNMIMFKVWTTCISLFLVSSVAEDASYRPPSPSSCASNQSSFDFIVVGGGTAGLAVATRLSQGLRSSCILVIEAGENGASLPGIVVPGRKGSTFGTKYDWNLTTIPQVNTAGRSIRMTRGKVLGGSSALNLLVWDRGSRKEYDAWEELGNDGWNWRNIYRYMLKAENYLLSPDSGPDGTAQGGYIETLINRIYPSQQQAFTPAMEKLGVRFNQAPLNGNPVGVSRQPNNIKEQNYSRSYSIEYLSHAGSNLALKLSTRVAMVNFDKKLKATGITLDDGTVINVSKEVILSAGTFQSSALLELSGIGDRNVLRKAGVKPRYHLRGVGQNFHDHPRIHTNYVLKPGSKYSIDRLRFNTTFVTEQLALYDIHKPSEYDYAASSYAFAPWSSVSSAASSSLLSLARGTMNAASPRTLEKQVDFLSDCSVPQFEVIFSDGLTSVNGYPASTDPNYGIETFTLIGGLMHPFSRGSVHIASSDVAVPPTIDPAYLTSPVDLAAQIVLAKYLRKIANTEPIRSLWTREYEPGDAVQSDAQWEEYIRGATSTFYHPVGTCAMLKEREGGVVDSDLKVYGTKRLRVVDSSVMPLLVTGHIQTLVYGIAEKAAESIIRDWR
ncbi:hypothetical protein BJ875DRAFT_73225 [Amylocarpus encephaloides]|uniref:Glucose-methanol-choline oxidoreductase N-terminal domain-containing protein n=1 Tax=Amylocarpus encephaloides TaxID=45428 RepID=A0A9P8C533_9HELO|nr:hypothetical protein BJ875DRAFT_73225 [Amylocarpus encephaloides]